MSCCPGRPKTIKLYTSSAEAGGLSCLGASDNGSKADALIKRAHGSGAKEGGGGGGGKGGGALTRLSSPSQEGDHVLGLLRLRGGRACAPAPPAAPQGGAHDARRRSTASSAPGRVSGSSVRCAAIATRWESRSLPPRASVSRSRALQLTGAAAAQVGPSQEASGESASAAGQGRTVVILNPLIVQHLGHCNGAAL